MLQRSQDVEVVRTFNAMGLKEDVLRGVFAYGFEKQLGCAVVLGLGFFGLNFWVVEHET